jgi:hypothetical protein
MICSSVNLLLRMSVSLENGLYPKLGAFKGSRSDATGNTRAIINFSARRLPSSSPSIEHLDLHNGPISEAICKR